MSFKFSLRKILLAQAAGIIAGIGCLIVAYIVGVVLVAMSLREVSATILIAFTAMPLVLLLVGVPLTLVVALMTAAPLGIAAMFRARPFGFMVGALVGMASCALVLIVLAPLIMPPQRAEFVQLIRNPYLSAGYGSLLGGLTSRIFRWLDPKEKVMREK